MLGAAGGVPFCSTQWSGADAVLCYPHAILFTAMQFLQRIAIYLWRNKLA